MTRPKIFDEEKYADKPYKCNECPKAYTQASALRRHKSQSHTHMVEEQQEHEEEMQRMIDKHDRNVKISANTFLTPQACRNMSRMQTDIECDDDDICGSHTVYEKQEIRETSSYSTTRDSGFRSPVVTTASGKKITLADPHAPPGSSCNRSSFTESSRNSSKTVSLRTSQTYVQLNNSGHIFDKNKPINSQERRNLYGTNLNSGDYNPGRPHYEGDDEDYNDENSFYNTKLQPTSNKDSIPISQLIRNGQFDPDGEGNRTQDQKDENVPSEVTKRSKDIAERSEDWALDPRYDEDANSTHSSLRSSTNNIIEAGNNGSIYGLVGSINPLGNWGKQPMIDKALLQYSKDAAITSLDSAINNYERNVQRIQNSPYLINTQKQEEPVLPDPTIMIDPNSLGTVRNVGPVFHTNGKRTIKCIVSEDFLLCLIQYFNDAKKAITHLKNTGVAIDRESADFNIVKKIYFDGKKKSEIPIRVLALSQRRMEFLNEEKEWRLDLDGLECGKIICNNLTGALLKMNNNMIAKILNCTDPEEKEILIDEYQLQKTQEHICDLGAPKFRLKLMKRIMMFIHGLPDDRVIE